jgi:hypothetical protein
VLEKASLGLFTLGPSIQLILKTNYKPLSAKEVKDNNKLYNNNTKDLFSPNNRPNTKGSGKASLRHSSTKPSLRLLRARSITLEDNMPLIKYLKLIINKDDPIDLTTSYSVYIIINNILANYINKITLNKLLKGLAYKNRNNKATKAALLNS